MAVGRKRKAGPRTKSGRPSRAGASPFDKGSEWVQERRERFGGHYTSALGRAYASKLLGEPAEALDRLQSGKRFARIYKRVIAVRGYRCPLNDNPRGNPDIAIVDFDLIERDQADQDWLFAAMNDLDRTGLRPWLDQLILDLYTDNDPPWLARMIAGGKHFGDVAILKAAIQALDLIGPRRS